MAETVATGGTKTFRYANDYSPSLKPEETRQIETAYDQYYQRRANEKKKKKIITAGVILLILIIILALILVL